MLGGTTGRMQRSPIRGGGGGGRKMLGGGERERKEREERKGEGRDKGEEGDG